MSYNSNSGYYYQGSFSNNNNNNNNNRNVFNNSNKFNNNNRNDFNSRKIKKILKAIGTVALSIFLILIITGSILATALTIYVMNFMDQTNQVTLDSATGCYNSIFYSLDENGEQKQLYSMGGDKRSIWVDIEEIPQKVRDAFVYAEDARFYTHDGVDFKRTFAATANLLLHFYATEQGGSTITQQTVKNITGDDKQDPKRKIREIFSSLDLEKRYSKTQILEAYMNVINVGGNYHGVEIGAQYYFDKNAKDLTIAEAACIVAITKHPTNNHPLTNETTFQNNKARKEYIINEMYRNGAISSEERDQALKQELKFIGDNKVEDEDDAKNPSVTSFYVDAAILDAKEILSEKLGISKDEVEAELKKGGFQIYTNVNTKLQSMLESKYLDYRTFQSHKVEDGPQSASILMDYKGNVLAYVGAIGPKTESRTSVFAMQGTKPSGSTIKPIASYGPAVELNKITWSSMIQDDYFKVKQKNGSYDYFMIDRDGDGKKDDPWPNNWNSATKSVDKLYHFSWWHLAESKNTGAVYVNSLVTPAYSYDFLKNKLHLDTLVDGDNAPAPMSIGDLTKGVNMLDLVATYQTFGNQGKYYKPHFVNKITDASGRIIWQNPYNEEQPFTAETAWIMNRMLKSVVDYNKYNKGVNVEMIGKTGTSNGSHDNWFIGCTPEYVGGTWIGDFEKQRDISQNFYYKQYKVWNNVFDDLMNTGTVKTFTPNKNVVEAKYCKKTGLLAGPGCTDTAIGYYKKDNLPPQCSGDHGENAQKNILGYPN